MARSDKSAPAAKTAAKKSVTKKPTKPKKSAAKKSAAKKPATKKPAGRRRPSAAAQERAREQERERTRTERAERLLALGLRPGDPVRFRRSDDKRWKGATVERVETDGSIGLRDEKGAARAIPTELVEIKTKGPRGGMVWAPLPDRIAAAEQLRLI